MVARTPPAAHSHRAPATTEVTRGATLGYDRHAQPSPPQAESTREAAHPRSDDEHTPSRARRRSIQTVIRTNFGLRLHSP